MAELTASERALVSAAVNKALTTDDPAALRPMAAPAGVGDLKEIFCKNWPTAKAVLQFLSGHLPIWLRPIVATIIRIGDAVHGAVCH